MFVLFSSSRLYRIINWLHTEGFSDLLASYCIFVLPTIFLGTFISFASNICLISALVFNAYVIIGRMAALYPIQFKYVKKIPVDLRFLKLDFN